MSTKPSSQEHGTPPGHYSAFWPILIVLATFTLLQGIHTKAALDQNRFLQKGLAEQSQPLAKSQLIGAVLESVGRDLIGLAASGQSEEANRILAEFNIRLNIPASAAPAAPVQTPLLTPPAPAAEDPNR